MDIEKFGRRGRQVDKHTHKLQTNMTELGRNQESFYLTFHQGPYFHDIHVTSTFFKTFYPSMHQCFIFFKRLPSIDNPLTDYHDHDYNSCAKWSAEDEATCVLSRGDLEIWAFGVFLGYSGSLPWVIGKET